ncbi:hypothetical protein PVK06_044183 [Gossypium arboreum]|uniref:Uncharacterized protein n=1 Tax=Gossypium arboreum TaxID=29729 RepID=A0ABR0MT19_GOSAR|nr:hypothetical protein PVK06_044183 [Gossypium arboreum]
MEWIRNVVIGIQHSRRVIKKPVNLDIVVSLIITNLLPYTQKIEPLGKMLEEIDAKDVATTMNPEEGNTYHGYEVDVSLDEMDVSATQLQSLKPSQDDSTFSKKEKRKDF